jgi:acyl carrier protein
MITDEIKMKLKTGISNMTETPVEEISEDASLAEVGIDSLMALELLVMLERTYHIEISQEELRHFTSINSVAELTARHIAESGQPTEAV